MVFPQLIMMVCGVSTTAIILTAMDHGSVNDNPALYDFKFVARAEEMRASGFGTLGVFRMEMHSPSVNMVVASGMYPD